jgi:hypothetical protein
LFISPDIQLLDSPDIRPAGKWSNRYPVHPYQKTMKESIKIVTSTPHKNDAVAQHFA